MPPRKGNLAAGESSLPRLLALDKQHTDFDERIKEAAVISGILLDVGDGKSTGRNATSRTRSEFALRWTLEKFKTADGRKACRAANLTWPFLKELIKVVPPSSTARLFQSNGFLENVAALLDECVGGLAGDSETASTPNATAEGEGNGVGSSKKRKRGEKAPSPSADGDASVSSEKLWSTIIGITSFLRSLISLARECADVASRAHLSSALKMGAEEAARLLDAWLRCVKKLIKHGNETTTTLLEAHDTIISIWSVRSREPNDETGASAETFSKACLPSLVQLLASETSTDLQASPDGLKVFASLEQLVAKHVFVPAHIFFDTAQAYKNPDLQKSRSALVTYLEPLKSATTTAASNSDTDAILESLPKLLQLAIRLSPHETPTQQDAQVPWLESVFFVLASCADDDLTSTPILNARFIKKSPLTPMLRILKVRDVNLSSEFLETFLVASSGLKGLRKGNTPLRLDVVAALLDLNGGMFLKEPATKQANTPTSMAGQPPYVETLIASLSEVKWTSSADPVDDGSRQTAAVAVEELLIPLLHAYNVSRKLPSFISLWFWECRRNWRSIGTPNELKASPWLSPALAQALREVLEISLSTSRVGELLVEFVLPIRQLVDEASRAAADSLDWTAIPATAPACASLVILDALLHSVEREETVQGNSAGWLALKDLPVQLAMLDLDTFPAASRVWSVIARVYKLRFWADGKAAFLEQQRLFLEGGEIFTKAVRQSSSNEQNQTGARSDVTIAAITFVWTVCGMELDPELTSPAQRTLNTILKSFLGKSSDEKGATTSSMAVAVHLACMASFSVQYPATLSLLSRSNRVALFTSLIVHDSDPVIAPVLDAVVATLLDGDKLSLEDMVICLTDHVVWSEDAEPQSLALDCLTVVPPNLVPRIKREQIVDGSAWLKKEAFANDKSGLFTAKTISLMVRMLEASCATAKLITDPSKAFELTDLLDSCIEQVSDQPNAALDLVRSIDRLFAAVMQQALVEAIEERRSRFFEEAIELAEEKANELSKLSTLVNPAVVLLLKNFISIASRLSSEYGEGLVHVRTRLYTHSWKVANSNERSPVAAWICSSAASVLLVLGVANIGQQPWPSSDQLDAVSDIEIDSKLNSQSDVLAFANKLDDVSSAQDFCKILDIFEQKMKNVRVHAKLEATQQLLEAGGVKHLQMLHVLLKHTSLPEMAEQEAAKQIFVKLCNVLDGSSEIGQFGAAISSLSTILRTKTFLVTQHGIDTLISTLTTLSSPQAPTLPAKHADFIYIRLCSLTTLILLLHRRRLGGRMHLLVALLQNLMTCLFTPHRYVANSPLPPWRSPTIPLSADATTSYTRILTTLVSPTASSTHTGHTSSLVSETKKAKEYAGQYAPYLILHYCNLQLNSARSGGEKLKMGLWAVMEVVDVEAMRGMNAGMGKGERVIWGSLWTEWQRVGRFRLN